MDLFKNVRIFSGSANKELAERVCDGLEAAIREEARKGRIPGIDIVRPKLAGADVKRFADGEIFVQLCENVRNKDVFIIQPTCPPVNDNLMELLIMVDAARRSSARSITAILPYYGYARQDRKSVSRTPITAALAARLIEEAGVDRLISVDLHAEQIQGFFHVPVDNLWAAGVLTAFYREEYKTVPGEDVKNLVLVSPDAGGAARCRAYAKRLRCDFAIVDKSRPRANECKMGGIVGDVEGKDCVLLDDLTDTAGSLTKASVLLLNAGAKKVEACVSHGVLSDPALDRIMTSPLERLVVTDTIPFRRDCPKVKVVSVAGLLAGAILAIVTEDGSISALLEG